MPMPLATLKPYAQSTMMVRTTVGWERTDGNWVSNSGYMNMYRAIHGKMVTATGLHSATRNATRQSR